MGRGKYKTSAYKRMTPEQRDILLADYPHGEAIVAITALATELGVHCKTLTGLRSALRKQINKDFAMSDEKMIAVARSGKCYDIQNLHDDKLINAVNRVLCGEANFLGRTRRF